MADDNTNYTGYRYLMDANNAREYAVKYEDGKPRPPFDVYGTVPGQNGFTPNETIFAFADDSTVQMKGDQPFMQVDAFQIQIRETGTPRRLVVTPVEYAITFDTKGKSAVKAILNMTDESKARLADEGFDAGFPTRFSYDLDQTQFQRKKGAVIVNQRVLETLYVPPHHGGYAMVARISKDHEASQALARAVQAGKTPAPEQVTAPQRADKRDYSAPDAQTLVEKKRLGDGDTLKIVFNFESRRVTESVFNAKGVGLTSHKFADYDLDALDAAFAQLKKMGGAPRPLNDGKKAGLPRPDNS